MSPNMSSKPIQFCKCTKLIRALKRHKKRRVKRGPCVVTGDVSKKGQPAKRQRKDVFIRISFTVIPWKPGDSDPERSQGCIQDSFPTLMRCSNSAPDGQRACHLVCNPSMCACIHFFVCVCVCVYVRYNYPRGLR